MVIITVPNNMRKILNPYQKAKIALESMKEDKTLNELAAIHQVHPTQIAEWKQIIEKEAHILLGPSGASKEAERIAELERMIGRREAEIEWFKKKFRSVEA